MKTSNTKTTRSPKSFLAIFFWALMIIPAFLFAVVIQVYGQTPFDFSLSASGPHNVVQGRDLYIKVSGKTLSGTRGNTYLSVQNAPAGTSRFWPDIFTSCCGDGNDGSYIYGGAGASADFDTTLRLTAGTTTPPGSYTIQVTAVSNGVTHQIPYTFSVLAESAPTIPPVISTMPAIPNLSNWQSNMTSYGQQVCNYLDTPGLTFDQKLTSVYYDQIRVMYQISDYIPTSASSWNTCALKARGVYRDGYVIPNNGGVPGHQIFTTGLRMDYERTGDTQSKNAALLLSQNASFAGDSVPLNWLIDPSTSRETAYAILAKLDSEKLGSATSPRLDSLVDRALGHIDQWFVSKSYRCPNNSACNPAATDQYYIQPFMVGLTMRALIVYYEKTADPRIPPMIKTAADWLWANAWVAPDNAFWYENWATDPSQPFPAQPGAADLNLLIGPAYGWLYRQTGDPTYQSRGDQIFSGGVLGSTTLGNGKQFDQNYIWSFDYVKWRTPSPSPFSIKINFQPAASAVPSGYIADSGLIYGDRGNGYTYGWDATTNNTVERNAANSPDKRYDTLNHLWNTANATWEIAVPNGTYTVHVVSGDALWYDSVYKINVEGVLTVNGTPTSDTRWIEGTQTVTVNDGKLTVNGASGNYNNKICFIDIYSN